MPRKILFRHMRAPGDVLMFTSGVRDFKNLFPEININIEVNKDFDSLFDNNPYLDRTINRNTQNVDVVDIGYPQIQGSNEGYTHFTSCFLQEMISHADAYGQKLNMTIGEYCSVFSGGGSSEWGKGKNAREPFITWRGKYDKMKSKCFKQRGDLHLSDKEISTNLIKDHYGIGNYWVVAPGGKRDCTAKIWDWRRFQKVIDHFEGMIKFVTIGRSDHLLEKLHNVIDFTDKTPSIRDLIPLVYHATGCVSNISFLMHLCAAIPNKHSAKKDYTKPCVAIYGSREPVGFTGYTHHQILHNNGSMDCAAAGGCWQSRVTLIAKDADQNKRMCHNTVVDDGRTIQQCMNTITADDVIRAIDVYYEGNIYKYSQPKKKIADVAVYKTETKPRTQGAKMKEINFLASLQSSGGGEQSACKIVEVLRDAGWKVNFYPWDKKHEKYKNVETEKTTFKNGMVDSMADGLPLIFYANDQIWDFCKIDVTGELINKSSAVIVGINFCSGGLQRSSWLQKTGKLKAVIFQNQEKLDEFKIEMMGHENTKLISLFGAIDLDKYLQLPVPKCEKGNPLVILKHCKPDWRKYVTKNSENNGKKIHRWQKDFAKENDVTFYRRLLNDCEFELRFEFMEAHPELETAFRNDERMIFHKWDSVDVGDFLKRGHIYLYRTSNLWRDNYPRCVAEALAVGIPVLTEPRDGTLDRVSYGNTGYHCIDYDQFLAAIKKYHRKENHRFESGRYAKQWARDNLDPKKWINTIEDIL